MMQSSIRTPEPIEHRAPIEVPPVTTASAAIVVPGIRGQVATGVRLALGVAWIVLVPAEMLGVDSGLGYQILNARDQIDYSLLAGVMLLIGAIGFAMDWLTQQLFKRWL